MKNLILLIVVILLSGCSERFPSASLPNNMSVTYKVVKITEPSLNQQGFSDYYLSTGTKYINWDNNYILCDSVGKFKIGDVLKIKLIK